MTVNKDEIRRRLAASQYPNFEDMRALLAELDAKDAEIARLQYVDEQWADGTDELTKQLRGVKERLRESEEARKAAERELELVRSTIADIEHNRKLNADEKAAAERERDRLEKRMKSYELRALRNAVTCDELRQQNADLLEAWVWVDEIRDSEPVMDEWHEAYAFRSVEERARTILDRYKDAQPEVQHECPCCGSDLDFYRDTATCPNDDCDYQAPYREDEQ